MRKICKTAVELLTQLEVMGTKAMCLKSQCVEAGLHPVPGAQ